MRYGIHTRLHRGRRISIFLTMRCPLQCLYCSLRAGGNFPLQPYEQASELTLDEWKPLLFNLFRFMPVREIYVTGGEPTLRDDVSGFVNFLLDEGKCVTLHSNLWTSKAMAIKRTNRFRIMATYHHGDSEDRFVRKYNKYSAKYRVDVHEINTCKLPQVTTEVRPFEVQGPEISGMTERFAIAPDGHMFVQMKKLYQHLGG